MTTPTGQIGMSSVNVEIGLPWNANIWLDHGLVRQLAGAGGGGTRMEMNWLRGKSSYVAVTATGSPDYYEENFAGTRFQNTITLQPIVWPAGGTKSYTYVWEFEDNSGGFTLSNANSQQCSISHIVGKYGGYYYCRMKCTVSDGRTSVVVGGMECYIDVYQGDIK